MLAATRQDFITFRLNATTRIGTASLCVITCFGCIELIARCLKGETADPLGLEVYGGWRVPSLAILSWPRPHAASVSRGLGHETSGAGFFGIMLYAADGAPLTSANSPAWCRRRTDLDIREGRCPPSDPNYPDC